jgi:hypothetical protein
MVDNLILLMIWLVISGLVTAALIKEYRID